MNYSKFFNISSYPSAEWSKPMKEVALYLADSIVDVPPPTIEPMASSGEVALLARAVVAKIATLNKGELHGEFAVCISCEQTLTAALVAFLPPNAYILCAVFDDEGVFAGFREIRFKR